MENYNLKDIRERLDRGLNLGGEVGDDVRQALIAIYEILSYLSEKECQYGSMMAKQQDSNTEIPTRKICGRDVPMF